MRYDFHPTIEGNWAVSEVNSDVPGGFAESSLMPKKVIEVLELDKSEFRFIDFSKIKNGLFLITGDTGAGKTTILQTVSNLLHSKTGSIKFLDEEIHHLPAHKLVPMGLAQVPEGRRVFSQMSVEENLELGAFTRPKANIKEDMEEIFERFPRLKERRRQLAGTLSGGEQQMLAMGRALMSHPKLLMLDEPSMGLSPLLVDQVFEIIKDINRDGTTILLVEQNAGKSLAISDRAYVMETGSIVLTGTGAELAASEKVRKAYLGG